MQFELLCSPLALLDTALHFITVPEAWPVALTGTDLLLDVDYKKHLLISARDFVSLQSN